MVSLRPDACPPPSAACPEVRSCGLDSTIAASDTADVGRRQHHLAPACIESAAQDLRPRVRSDVIDGPLTQVCSTATTCPYWFRGHSESLPVCALLLNLGLVGARAFGLARVQLIIVLNCPC